VLGRAAAHDRTGPRFDLPGALAGRHDERGAAEPQHARLERRQGAQRRVHEQQAEDLARERVWLGPLLQAAREVEQVYHLVAGEIGEIEEAVHGKRIADSE